MSFTAQRSNASFTANTVRSTQVIAKPARQAARPCSTTAIARESRFGWNGLLPWKQVAEAPAGSRKRSDRKRSDSAPAQEAEAGLTAICQLAASVATEVRQQYAELYGGISQDAPQMDYPAVPYFSLHLSDDESFVPTASYEEDSDAALWIQDEIANKSVDELTVDEDEDAWPVATDALGFVELLRDLSQATVDDPADPAGGQH